MARRFFVSSVCHKQVIVSAWLNGSSFLALRHTLTCPVLCRKLILVPLQMIITIYRFVWRHKVVASEGFSFWNFVSEYGLRIFDHV